MDGHGGHDLTTAAMWGGALAGGGAVARAVQTPQTWRTFSAVVLTGILFGAIAVVLILWRYPSVPLEVGVMAAAFVGFVSTHLSQIAIKAVEGLSSRVIRTIDSKADALGLEKGDTPDGRNPAPAGSGRADPAYRPEVERPETGVPGVRVGGVGGDGVDQRRSADGTA